jgi:hypothetical protein
MVPPNILLNNWESDWVAERENIDVLLTQAYQAGADAELEACCEWLVSERWFKYEHEAMEFVVEDLRAARRPKPPSLKERSLALIDKIQAKRESWLVQELDVVRKALEQIDD